MSSRVVRAHSHDVLPHCICLPEHVMFFFTTHENCYRCSASTAFRGTTPTAFRGTLKMLSWRDHDFSFEYANFFCILSFQLLVFNVSFPYYVLLVLCLSLLLSFSFFFSSFVIFLFVCFSFLMFLLCDSVSCQLIDSVS